MSLSRVVFALSFCFCYTTTYSGQPRQCTHSLLICVSITAISASEKGHQPDRALDPLADMQWREQEHSDPIQNGDQRMREGTASCTCA